MEESSSSSEREQADDDVVEYSTFTYIYRDVIVLGKEVIRFVDAIEKYNMF